MSRVHFSPEAEADLVAIALHIAADDPERALAFVAELESRCLSLTRFPGRGRDRADLAANLRSLVHGRYIIFYTPAATVRIERILHGSRDLDAEFRAPTD
ncbi:MAG TPA: type II toxin-antitoxin system RelE/ParE family toxin [Allosphingosinicella sp.]